MQRVHLQNDQLGVAPAVKPLLHDKLVVAGNPVVGNGLRRLPCGEVVCLNVLHVGHMGGKASGQQGHSPVAAVLGDEQRELLPGWKQQQQN